MPAGGTDALMIDIATSPKCRLKDGIDSHHLNPCVKATILRAGVHTVVVARSNSVGAIEGVPVVQVLSHPCLRPDLDGAVGLGIAIVYQHPIGDSTVPWNHSGSDGICRLVVWIGRLAVARGQEPGGKQEESQQAGQGIVHGRVCPSVEIGPPQDTIRFHEGWRLGWQGRPIPYADVDDRLGPKPIAFSPGEARRGPDLEGRSDSRAESPPAEGRAGEGEERDCQGRREHDGLADDPEPASGMDGDGQGAKSGPQIVPGRGERFEPSFGTQPDHGGGVDGLVGQAELDEGAGSPARRVDGRRSPSRGSPKQSCVQPGLPVVPLVCTEEWSGSRRGSRFAWRRRRSHDGVECALGPIPGHHRSRRGEQEEEGQHQDPDRVVPLPIPRPTAQPLPGPDHPFHGARIARPPKDRARHRKNQIEKRRDTDHGSPDAPKGEMGMDLPGETERFFDQPRVTPNAAGPGIHPYLVVSTDLHLRRRAVVRVHRDRRGPAGQHRSSGQDQGVQAGTRRVRSRNHLEVSRLPPCVHLGLESEIRSRKGNESDGDRGQQTRDQMEPEWELADHLVRKVARGRSPLPPGLPGDENRSG